MLRIDMDVPADGRHYSLVGNSQERAARPDKYWVHSHEHNPTASYDVPHSLLYNASAMTWVQDYRIFSYVISLGSVIAVFIASIVTLHTKDGVDMSFTYAKLGIASAVITFLPLLIILLRECTTRPVDVKTELITLPLLSVFWLAAGGVTVVARVDAFGHGPCDALVDPARKALCTYAEPILTFSFVPAGLMLSYELLLLLIGTCGEHREKPIWARSIRGHTLREAGF